MSPQLWKRSTSPCRMPTHRVLSQDTPKSHTLSHRKQCSKKENGMLVSLAIRACRGEQQLKHQINQASAKRGTKSLFSLNFVFEEWGIWKSILTWFVSIFHGGNWNKPVLLIQGLLHLWLWKLGPGPTLSLNRFAGFG